MSIPRIKNINLYKIYEFTEKLLGSVKALETMGKLKEINEYVRLTLDKLESIRADLVRKDNGWQEWKSPQLVEILESGLSDLITLVIFSIRFEVFILLIWSSCK